MRSDFGWELPQSITVRLGASSYGRQRAIVEDGHLLLILHRPPEPNGERSVAAVFWRKPDGQWESNGQRDGLPKLRRLVTTYEALATDMVAEYRKANTPDTLFALLAKLTPLARAAAGLHAAMQSAREQVKLDGDIIELRDRTCEMSHSLELLLEDAKNALTFRMAQNAEADARNGREAIRAQHRLNILAAVFFPVTAVAGIFGMNLPNGLDSFGAAPFWLIFLSGLVFGLALRGWVVSSRRGDGPMR